jgi:hypothetical protein
MNPVNLLRFPERLMKKQTVEFSSHTANLALMRNCVRKFLNSYPFSERERLLMVLGVDEACTNVIRYAYRLRARLWRTGFAQPNERSLSRYDQTGWAWIISHS